MPSKYDTNPLDPDFPERAKAAAAAQPTQTLPYGSGATRHFPPSAATEQQTQKFGQPGFQQYQQPYGGQYVPAQYQPASFVNVGESGKRKVAKVGLSENIVTALPYIPWYFGMIAGVILLFLLPRTETKARFHAAQGLATHIGIMIISTMLGIIGNITGVARAGNIIFQIVMTIMLIVWTTKAWRGKPVHIESVDSLTNWLDEKIHPKLAGN